MAFLRSVSRCNTALTSRQHLLWNASQSPVQSPAALGDGSNDERRQQQQQQPLSLGGVRYYSSSAGQPRQPFSTAGGALSAVCAPGSAGGPATTTDGSPRDALDTSFDNAEAAFKSKTTWELVRAYAVYLMCSSGYIVDNNLQVHSVCYTWMALSVAWGGGRGEWNMADFGRCAARGREGKIDSTQRTAAVQCSEHPRGRATGSPTPSRTIRVLHNAQNDSGDSDGDGLATLALSAG